ncbi:MAG: YceD family protein [Chloroflexota bacterium]
MIFNVAGLLKDEVGATRYYELFGESVQDPDGSFTDIEASVRMLRTDRGILVQAAIAGATKSDCARCLESAAVRLETDLEEEFFPMNPDLGIGSSLFRESVMDEAEETEFWIDEMNELDMSEAIRQALITVIPMAPLCRQDCEGICPECGSNRNHQACSCDTSYVDPRLAALLDFKAVN